MGTQPKAKVFQESAIFPDRASARPIPVGVVARGEADLDTQLFLGFVGGRPSETFPEHYPTAADGAFPTKGPVLRRVLERGRLQFTIYCSMCHGDSGDGRGIIVQRGMVQPPDYLLDRLRVAPVGHFVDVINNGYGQMFGYGDRVGPADRWAIVAYIRVLQSARATEVKNLTPEQSRRLEAMR
jgi:mono/diheme cytochrome c family protein